MPSQTDTAEQTSVLVVEDDFLIAQLITQTVADAGLSIAGVAANMSEALAICRMSRPDFATMDIRLQGDTNGIEVSEMLANDYDIPCLFISAMKESRGLAEAATQRCLGWVQKPFLPSMLKAQLSGMSRQFDSIRAVQ